MLNTNNFMYDVFFSYSRNSLALAKKIIYELEKYDVYVWFDYTDVILGSTIKPKLYETLNNIKTEKWKGFIALIDETYFKKEWCLMEFNYAVDNNITIFPIFFNCDERCIPKEQFIYIKNINYIYIKNSNNIEYCLNKLVDAIMFNFKFEKHLKLSYNKILKQLIQAYYCTPKLHVEKIICANNLICYFKIMMHDNFKHDENFLATVVTNKTKKLYHTGKLSYYDIKIACRATELLLSIFIGK